MATNLYEQLQPLRCQGHAKCMRKDREDRPCAAAILNLNFNMVHRNSFCRDDLEGHLISVYNALTKGSSFQPLAELLKSKKLYKKQLENTLRR